MKKCDKVRAKKFINNNNKQGGEKMKPFLRLPFKEQKYRVTEGWIYSEEEQNIHGCEGHGSIDFMLPEETEVFAAEDGLAIASYFSYKMQRKYQGKDAWFGLGYFVQIYHPKYKVHTVYGHLNLFNPKIKFHKPKKDGRFLFPVGHKVYPEKLSQYKFSTKVKKGDLLGYVGNSGLGWGCSDYPKKLNNFVSWDEFHLHFEVVKRVPPKMVKEHFDPYGIKTDFKMYPDSFRPENKKNIGQKGDVIWILGKDGMPEFIK